MPKPHYLRQIRSSRFVVWYLGRANFKPLPHVELLILMINVWFVIWPNQKRALGIVECEAELKAKSAKTAMLFSRANTLLSLPMLLSMVAAQNLY